MTVAPKARFGQAEGAPKRQRASGAASKPVSPAIPVFRTVLVASVGWPTEASIPGTRKRPAKR